MGLRNRAQTSHILSEPGQAGKAHLPAIVKHLRMMEADGLILNALDALQKF
jgi:hypothetical protein